MKDLSVAKWVEVAGLTAKDIPTQVDVFWSEVDEFKDAGTYVEQLDAICDMAWVDSVIVALGGDATMTEVVTFSYLDGWNLDTFALAFNEVRLSNFSKFCQTEDEARQSVREYLELNCKTTYDKVGDYYVIRSAIEQPFRDEVIPAGKIMKGVNYFKPNLEQFV